MKKWLIVLSIIFGISFISTAILAGRVYYQDLKVYTDYDTQALEVAALKNVYIKSSIPIEVYPTKGEPYVEFNQTFSDLLGAAPEYKLNVQVKGESTYIELEETKEVFLWLGVKESKAQLSVYLPESTINRLSIEDQDYYSSHRRDGQMINLEGINVNELDVSGMVGEFVLDGSYGKINISSRGNITLNSKTPVELYINESMNQHLSGEFKKITVQNNHGTKIVIDSQSASQVDINNNNGRIDLKGKYSKVKVNGSDYNLDLRSDSICELWTEGYENTIIANGPFKEMHFTEEHSSIEVKTTIAPNKLSFGRASRNNEVLLTVPSNIPGFTVKYAGSYDMEEEYETDYMESNVILESDFTLLLSAILL